MATTLRQTIPPQDAGRTLHEWLVGRFRYLDAAGWLAQFAAGRITRNGALATAEARLAAGDQIAFTPAPPPPESPRPGRTIPVLYADLDLVVVDKAPHLVVQHEAAFLQFTFLNDLAERFPPGDGQPRLEPVHRLDRETSGVLVLARSPRAARGMQRQFEAHTIEKEYLAVASGTIAADLHELHGSIGPAAASTVPTRRAVVPDGTPGARRAHTTLRVLQHLQGATLVSLRPHTGRTHQLRVHLEQLGHPLVGDKLYGHDDARHWRYLDHLKRDGDPRWPEECAVGRQLLHALRLTCTHPRSGTPLTFAAPWPPDLAAFVRARGGTVPTSA
ncbi:MAG: RluA family pseudouridine synthase [Planctomycetota bacterium]